jgi:transcription initiation factor IIE alpha subunit
MKKKEEEGNWDVYLYSLTTAKKKRKEKKRKNTLVSQLNEING